MSIVEAREHWRGVINLGEAILALQRTRDSVALAGADPRIVASLDVLAGSAQSMLRDLGQAFAFQRDSADPETAAFVTSVLTKLQPATVPDGQQTRS